MAAIARAGGTASRAVLFSAMTVVLALIGMVLVPFNQGIAPVLQTRSAYSPPLSQIPRPRLTA